MVYVLGILYSSLPTPTLIIKRVHHLTHFEFGLIHVTSRLWARSARMLVFNASFKRHFMVPAHPLVPPQEEKSLSSCWCQMRRQVYQTWIQPLAKAKLSCFSWFRTAKQNHSWFQNQWSLRCVVVSSTTLVQETWLIQ